MFRGVFLICVMICWGLILSVSYSAVRNSKKLGDFFDEEELSAGDEDERDDDEE